MLLLLSDIGEGDVAPRRAMPALLPITWVLFGINLHDHRAASGSGPTNPRGPVGEAARRQEN